MQNPLWLSGRYQLLWRVRTAAAVGLLILIVPSAAMSQLITGAPNLKALYVAVGRMHNIDADLLAAMAEVESGGDPLSVSPQGAIGLMQLMPSTAARFAVPDPFDPVSNVLGAADFIDYLRARFATSLDLQGLPDLLAAYNAGPGTVEKYGGIPPYRQTHQYVRRVLQRYISAVAARPRAAMPSTPPGAVVLPLPSVTGPQPVIAGDGDGLMLDQLATIRRLRGRFMASLEHHREPWAGLAAIRSVARSH